MSAFCGLGPLFLIFIGAGIGIGVWMSKSGFVEFLISDDLWANIVGGVVAAGVIALIAYLWNRRRHRILKELTKIMGKAIKHRNIGKQGPLPDEDKWIREAKAIESEAIAKAKNLSSTAGSLVEWLDNVDPWHVNSEVEKYVSILSKVIDRIRELLERNS